MDSKVKELLGAMVTGARARAELVEGYDDMQLAALCESQGIDPVALEDDDALAGFAVMQLLLGALTPEQLHLLAGVPFDDQLAVAESWAPGDGRKILEDVARSAAVRPELET